MSPLTHESAQALVNRAFQKARELNLPVAVAVVDAQGFLVAFGRMPSVSPMAVEVTRRKAWTSANFRLPTKVLVQVGASDPALAADFAKNPDICMVGGGLPIMHGPDCLGAVGVAGGRAEQDHQIAEAALKEFS